ncbi:MlaD family protein, partial [Nocardia brasiliensis]|uniref:MlaD family protein n=1 Tax=Nocardia brasiliensis TaxID=37326 RepID=UPI0024562E55
MASRTRFLIATAFLAAVILVACGVLYAVRHTGEADAAHVCPEDAASSDPGWMSSNTDVDAAFDEHPFVGNGYLGLRVPPRGSGYALTGEPSGWPLYTPRYDGAFVAGLYGHTPGLADDREVAAALPNWSTLTVGAGDDTFSTATPAAQITKFAQTRYLRCGLVRTTLTWTGRDGKVTDLVYEVLAERPGHPDRAKVISEGVVVGMLDRIELTGDTAVATVDLKSDVRLPKTATAELRQSTILGDIH